MNYILANIPGTETPFINITAPRPGRLVSTQANDLFVSALRTHKQCEFASISLGNNQVTIKDRSNNSTTYSYPETNAAISSEEGARLHLEHRNNTGKCDNVVMVNGRAETGYMYDGRVYKRTFYPKELDQSLMISVVHGERAEDSADKDSVTIVDHHQPGDTLSYYVVETGKNGKPGKAYKIENLEVKSGNHNHHPSIIRAYAELKKAETPGSEVSAVTNFKASNNLIVNQVS